MLGSGLQEQVAVPEQVSAPFGPLVLVVVVRRKVVYCRMVPLGQQRLQLVQELVREEQLVGHLVVLVASAWDHRGFEDLTGQRSVLMVGLLVGRTNR